MFSSVLHINGRPWVHLSSRSNPDRSSLFYRPMAVNMSGKCYWASIQADIEAHIEQALLPLREPSSVFEPMRHLVFAAQRSPAPALCIAACELVGGQRGQAMAAASALQLVHAAYFTHEHLPSTSRPKPEPMIHVYGPNIELLTGDGIASFGLELLARAEDPGGRNSDRVLRVVIEIARVAGAEGIVDGQYQRVLYDESNGGKEGGHVEVIKRICEKKEGGLHACGAACGAILGGGSEEEIEIVRKYGFYVGMIQGMSHFCEEKELEVKKEMEELRNLAFKELKGFKGRDVEAISSFLS